MTLHIVRPCDSFCVRFFPILIIFSCFRRTSWFEHFSVLFNNTFVRLAFTLSASQICVAKERMLVLQDRQVSSISSTWERCSPFFQSFWCHPRTPIRTMFVFDEQTDIPNAGLLPSQERPNRTSLSFPQEPSKWVSRTSFVREESRDLRCFDHEFGHLSRVRRIQKSGHSDFWIFLQFWRVVHLTLVCKQISHRLLVLHNQVVLQWHPLHSLPSFVTQTELALWTQHRNLNRLSPCHLWVQPDLCGFETSILTPLSWDNRCPSA